MLNTAAIMGRLVAAPELKHTPSGVAVTSFALAVDRNYAKPGEERQTDWIDVVAWRGTAEFICKYFTKGRMIAVTGSLQTRVWEDKNGSKARESGGGDPAGQLPPKAEAQGEPVKDFFQGDLGDFEELKDEDLPF